MVKERHRMPAPSPAPAEIKTDNPASEVSEEIGDNVSTSEVEVATLTLEDYLKKVMVNPGMVASFKVEARTDSNLLEDKTEEGWKAAFDAQSKRIYE